MTGSATGYYINIQEWAYVLHLKSISMSAASRWHKAWVQQKLCSLDARPMVIYATLVGDIKEPFAIYFSRSRFVLYLDMKFHFPNRTGCVAEGAGTPKRGNHCCIWYLQIATVGVSWNAFFPWYSLYSIFGYVGWLERQRHVLICVWRSSSLSQTETVQASSPPPDGKGSVFTCSTQLRFH